MTRSGWLALSVTVVARGILATLLSLLAWSLLPALLGWHPTLVMTGSMLPRLTPGDVVMSRPVDPASLRLGQVLLVDNPDHPGQLRLHRFVRVATDSRLILRGDANPSPDSTPVSRSAVHGVAVLRIPEIGRPLLWADESGIGALVITTVVLAVLIRVAFWWRPGSARGPADDPREHHNEQSVRTVRRRILIVGTSAIVVVAVAGGNANAATKFTKTTGNPTDRWIASTWFTCANAVKGNNASFALPLSDGSPTTAGDISGHGANGTYSSAGVTYGVTGPCTHDGRTAVTLDGTAGKITQPSPPTGAASSYEIWFKAPSTSHGGGLMSTTNNGGKQTKMALAMTSTGNIAFAVGSSSSVVTTAGSYNDNAWHLAVGTISGAAIALYIDDQSPVGVATPANGTSSKCNIGWDSHTDLGTGTLDFFQGSIGFAAAYSAALTSTQVAAHYAAAG